MNYDFHTLVNILKRHPDLVRVSLRAALGEKITQDREREEIRKTLRLVERP